MGQSTLINSGCADKRRQSLQLWISFGRARAGGSRELVLHRCEEIPGHWNRRCQRRFQYAKTLEPAIWLGLHDLSWSHKMDPAFILVQAAALLGFIGEGIIAYLLLFTCSESCCKLLEGQWRLVHTYGVLISGNSDNNADWEPSENLDIPLAWNLTTRKYQKAKRGANSNSCHFIWQKGLVNLASAVELIITFLKGYVTHEC